MKSFIRIKITLILIILLVPVNLSAQWINQNSGQTANLFSVHFIDKNNGWVAGNSEVVLRTRDGGQSWGMAPGHLYPTYSHWSSLFFVNEQSGYVCGNYEMVNFLDPYASYFEAWWKYTTDGGNVWTTPSGTFIPNDSKWTDVFFLNENIGWKVGYRNGEGKVNKTTTGVGNNWANGSTVDEPLYSIMFVDENNGWMVGDAGAIYSSTDGGISWTKQASGIDKALRSVYFLNSNNGWCTGFSSNQATILKTSNGGQSWSQIIPSGINELHSIYFEDELSGWVCGSKFVNSTERGIILYSDDGGINWVEQHVDYSASVLYDLTFVEDKGYAVGTDGVILEYFANRENHVQFSGLADMNNGKYGAGFTTDGTNLYSISGGLGEAPWKSTEIEKYNVSTNSWSKFAENLIPRNYCNAEYITWQNKIFIFNGDTYNTNTYTDTVEIVDVASQGITYSPTNPNPVEYGGSAVWDGKIYLFGGSNASGFSNRLYEFNPINNVWTRLQDMPEAKQTCGEIINGILYVIGGYNGSSSKRIDAYDIQSGSWSYLGNLPTAVSAHSVTSVGNDIWIVGSFDDITYLGVYNVSTNSFTLKSSNMIGRRHAGVTSIGNDIFICGGNQSSDNQTVLKSLQVTDALVNVEPKSEEKSFTYELLQNYPNPFNPTTTITFSIPKSSDVKVVVYNSLGQEIKTILKENKQVGNYTLNFDASDLSSGVYFYQIIADDFVDTKKMLLIK